MNLFSLGIKSDGISVVEFSSRGEELLRKREENSNVENSSFLEV